MSVYTYTYANGKVFTVVTGTSAKRRKSMAHKDLSRRIVRRESKGANITRSQANACGQGL